MLLRLNSKSTVVVLGAFLLAISSTEARSSRSVAGLDNEGCEGSYLSESLDRLKQRLPSAKPIIVQTDLCSPGGKCDGGFAWLPFMVNLDRGWILHSYRKKGNWVALNFHNICNQKKVLTSEYLNEVDSAYTVNGTVYSVGWVLDKKQVLYDGHEKLAVGLSYEKGLHSVAVHGLDNRRKQSRLLDRFTVTPL